jgi:hypothetical protein
MYLVYIIDEIRYIFNVSKKLDLSYAKRKIVLIRYALFLCETELSIEENG